VSHPLGQARQGEQRQALSGRSGGGSGLCTVTVSEDKSPVGGQLVNTRNNTHHQTIFLHEVNQQMPNHSPAPPVKAEKGNLGAFKQGAD